MNGHCALGGFGVANRYGRKILVWTDYRRKYVGLGQQAYAREWWC